MINLKQVLSSFTDEKQKEFINYLEKKNKRKDAKNIALTKLLLHDNYSSKEMSEKLYGKQNIVALHALRKRLLNAIIDFSANSSFKEESSLNIKLIKQIVSARRFLEQEQIKIGYQILDKTEVIAKEHQLFTILKEVYHTKIQYSYANTNIDLDSLIVLFKENQKQLKLEDSLNIVYTKIRKSLIDYQQKQTKQDIKSLIYKKLNEQGIVNFEELSFKSLYQILQITNVFSLQNFDYWNIEVFAVDTYKIIKNHKSKNKQLYYHIEILYVIANILFRNKKFEESLRYLELMHSLMNENKQKYLNHFLPKHDLLVSLNYNYSKNQEKGMLLLESYINKKNVAIITQLDIYLSLIVYYFQNENFEKAQKLISKFYHTDQWYINKAGIIWTIKKSLIEILLQIDLGNIDLVDSRLKSFKRNYFKYLKEINQDQVINYLKLVETYYKHPETATTESFYKKVENSFNWIDREKEDIFMMSFFAWLKAKMTKQKVYLVTLDLINS